MLLIFNIILFAFIVTLGIIVDDAVIVGENIYEKRLQGMSFQEAAIAGAKEMTGPVTFAVLTNIAAFLPLFFVPGDSGNLYKQIPAIVISVFIVSLFESLFVLPAHLSHSDDNPSYFWRIMGIPSTLFNKLMAIFAKYIHEPLVYFCVKQRYITLAVALGCLFLSLAYVISGKIPFSFMPKIDSDRVTAQASLPFGVAIEESRKVQQQLIVAAKKVIAENGGDAIVRGIYAQIGSPLDSFAPGVKRAGAQGSHLVSAQVYLVQSDERKISSTQFANEWRTLTESISNVETLTFNSSLGNSSGAPIQIEFSHRSNEILDNAAHEITEALKKYKGVKDIDDGVSRGKPQINFKVRPEASSLNLTTNTIATQVRGAFFGIEALRQQRGRSEIKIMVRLPTEERETYHTLEQMVLLTPTGTEIPFLDAVDFEYGYAYTEIARRDGRRIVSVTADIDENFGNANIIVKEIVTDVAPLLQKKYNGEKEAYF